MRLLVLSFTYCYISDTLTAKVSKHTLHLVLRYRTQEHIVHKYFYCGHYISSFTHFRLNTLGKKLLTLPVDASCRGHSASVSTAQSPLKSTRSCPIDTGSWFSSTSRHFTLFNTSIIVFPFC